MILEKDDLARFRVDFIKILKFCRVKFQNPTGATGVAAQFFFGIRFFKSITTIIAKTKKTHEKNSQVFLSFENAILKFRYNNFPSQPDMHPKSQTLLEVLITFRRRTCPFARSPQARKKGAF